MSSPFLKNLKRAGRLSSLWGQHCCWSQATFLGNPDEAGHFFSLLGLAPGGVYRTVPLGTFVWELLPPIFNLALCHHRRPVGGVFSVALSLSSSFLKKNQTVAVSNHPAQPSRLSLTTIFNILKIWSPDFPLGLAFALPSDSLTCPLIL